MKFTALLSLFLTLSLVGLDASSQKNDSTLIKELKLADAKTLNLHNSIGYKLADGQLLYDTFTKFLSADERLALGLPDSTSISLVEVKQLFRPLSQRGDLSVERKEIALVDSIYHILLTQDISFASLVTQFSATKEHVLLDLRGVPEELEQVLKEMAIGDISRPILAPQGIYMFEKVGDVQKKFATNTSLSPKAFLDVLVQNGIIDGEVNTLGEWEQRTRSVATSDLVNDVHTPSAFLEGELASSRQNRLLKMLLVKKLEAKIRTLDNFQEELNRGSDSLLLELVYNERVRSVCNNDTLGFTQFYNEHKGAYQTSYARFSGLIVRAKRKVIRKLERTFEDLPHEQWVVALELLQKEGKVGKITYSYGEDFLINNSLAAEFYALSSLSDKKKRKAERRYLVKGAFTPMEEDTPYLQAILKREYQNYIEEQWTNYLLEEHRKRKKK